MGTSYLAVGYDCNHKGICCPLTTYDRLHKRFGIEEIKRRIDMIPLSDENHVVVSGGEPMLHPDFLDILSYLNEKNFSVTILSNSSMCKNKEFVEKLGRYKNISVITAIHSSNPKIHDEMTGVPGSLLETLEGLDNLAAQKVPVTIKHILNAVTLPSLTDTFDYLEKHFPPQVGFQFCAMDYSGRAGKNRDKLFASREAIEEGLKGVLDLLESRMSKQRKISVIETPYCFADPYYWKYFQGAVSQLSSYIAPNTDEAEVIYEFNSQCHSEYQPCRKCALKPYCPGVWKSAYELDHNLVNPINSYK